ncbi:MAG TPA: hypothetical protein VFA41_13670 [Ktedonobacteraceae bacterium]|jgi:hypothetical protein|nr:hypothetical protein [Ktedonobacteraceae bacterium]
MLLQILVTTLLGLAALVFVLYPLYHRPPLEVAEETAALAQATGVAEGEQTASAALREVELDYQLGNLEESDYRSLRERYMRRAFLAMKARRAHEQELDALIEEQLRQMKEKTSEPAHEEQATIMDEQDEGNA